MRSRPLNRLQDRYARTSGEGTNRWRTRDEELAGQGGFKSRVLQPTLDRLSSAGGLLTSQKEKSNLQQMLLRAGYPGGVTVQQLQGIRVLLAVGVPAVLLLILWGVDRVTGAGLMSPALAALLAVVLAVIGWLSLPFILRNMIKKRQKQMERNLPDVLDLITIAVEAGLGFDAAMDRVGNRYPGPMGEELIRTTGEIRMGRPWNDAMKDMAERTGVEAVASLVTALVQARELGVNLGNVLRAQSLRLREERARKAREQAQKAPTKMMIPLILFIFPTLFIVLIGPAALRAAKTLSESDAPIFGGAQ